MNTNKVLCIKLPAPAEEEEPRAPLPLFVPAELPLGARRELPIDNWRAVRGRKLQETVSMLLVVFSLAGGWGDCLDAMVIELLLWCVNTKLLRR